MSSVKIENISQTRKRLVVGIDADTVTKAEKEVLAAVSKEANVPGFRAGKAPIDMVKKRYAKVIDDELQRRVIGQSYQDALKEAKLDLCSVVGVDGDPIAAGTNSTVTVTVDVYPEFETPKYKELEVKLPKVNVEEKEVDKTIDLIRGQRAEFTPVERAAEAGDYVRISYTGTLDGKPVAEIAPDKPMYGTQKSTWEEAGEHDYGIKAITTGVIGMAKEDKKTVTETFAADFEVAALAGKTVSYELELLEVREKKLPEMDEEFFKSVGVENLEKLKEQVRQSLEGRARQESDVSKRTQLSDQLVEAIGEVELPESLLQGEQQNVMNELVSENQKRGITEEALKENEATLVQSAKEAARKRVTLRMILRKIAEAEKVEVEQSDFQKWVMQEAMQSQSNPDKIV